MLARGLNSNANLDGDYRSASLMSSMSQIPTSTPRSAANAVPARRRRSADLRVYRLDRAPAAGCFRRLPGLAFLVWTALPTLLYANLPLDLIEALTYGREWQLGYDKLPPLPWWLVEIMYRLIGTDAVYYALAQAAVIIAFARSWLQRGRSLARPARSLPC